MNILNQLKIKLKETGAECCFVPSGHIPELESRMNQLYKNLFIEPEIYKKYILNYLNFPAALSNTSIHSLIIIATPSPPVSLKFNYEGNIFQVIVPPTYTDKIIVNEKIKKITTELFDFNGYSTIPVVLPKKLLAVHSGLAKFGKNNICYVDGMGSFVRLTVFGSDLPCEKDTWQDVQLLDRCRNCKICKNNCPTSAIHDDRFVISAHRCLTYFNEQQNPFPDWIKPNWHNSLIGCMRCQDICPENKKYISELENKEEFSEIETNLILQGVLYNELPESLQIKLKNLCFDPCYNQVSRNLAVILKNKLN